VQKCPSGKFVTVKFAHATYTFHSQWLHDAQMDDGPYKTADNAYSRKTTMAEVSDASTSGEGITSTMNISWTDGRESQFPCLWLWVYASLVGKCEKKETTMATTEECDPPEAEPAVSMAVKPIEQIEEISYTDLFPTMSESTRLHVYEVLVHPSFAGILKITNLPAPDVHSERHGENTLVVSLLTHIFGGVFDHPRRTTGQSYNISSHHASDVAKGLLVPNYNTAHFLLPHVDQSFYQHHTRIVGLYVLEGESVNSFVSAPAVLEALRKESPELVTPLYTCPMALGRAGKMYTPTIYQGTTATAVTTTGNNNNVVCHESPLTHTATSTTAPTTTFRWHPHYVGSLLCDFDAFPAALAAHRAFQAISDRPAFQTKLPLRPGDMYLFDNHRVLHGRDCVVREPRTCVGQSVTEQVVLDGWRDLLVGRLLRAGAGGVMVMPERWLVHVPLMQLYEMDRIVMGGCRPCWL
jgi:alpha-ketoglutarate-dependent taurine dioxygenase